MQVGGFDKFTGEVEADESFVDDKGQFMLAKVKRERGVRADGGDNKSVVVGVLQRGDERRPSQVRVRGRA